MIDPAPSAADSSAPASHRDVFLTALRLGCTSFGGPIAHIGYFRAEYVQRRKWLTEETFADLVALCQFLPGPASSQVGIGIGTIRAGRIGGLLAWLGFTLPSFLVMTAFALLLRRADLSQSGWIHGLNIVAVPVVALAVYGMAKQFCRDWLTIALAVSAMIVLLLLTSALAQAAILVCGGILGWRLIKPRISREPTQEASPISRRFGLACLIALALILVGTRVAWDQSDTGGTGVFRVFFSVGAQVFGGGHVVLPLLQRQVIPAGWMSESTFLSGYGAAQAVPGPLFTFAAFLGAAREPTPNGITGAALATVAIFLPSIFLVFGGFPFWDQIRTDAAFRGALAGVNAAVVGVLAAAFINPVWTTAINRIPDLGIAIVCFLLLAVRRWPAWSVVMVAAGLGEVVSRIS